MKYPQQLSWLGLGVRLANVVCGLLLVGLLLYSAQLSAAPEPSSPVSDPELTQLQSSFDLAQRRLQASRTELARKQALHARLITRLEELKGGPIQSFRLEQLQRTARSMADEVRLLQQAVDQAQELVSQSVSRLQTHLRRRLTALEGQEPRLPEERLRWVRQQAELLGQLQQLGRLGPGPSLPQVPRNEVQSSDGPEELREMADELADVGEKYLTHAAALAQRIAELMKEQRLARLASDLTREERLFDEATRFRRVVTSLGARSAPASTGGAPAPPSSKNGGSTSSATDRAPTQLDQESATGPNEPAETDGQQGSWNGADDHDNDAAPTPGGSFSGDPSAEASPGARGDEGLTGGGIEVPIAEAAGNPGAELTGGPGDSAPALQLGVRLEVEPRGLLPTPTNLNSLDPATQLRWLEQQRSVTARRGQQLLQQAGSLRQQAETLRRQEGL